MVLKCAATILFTPFSETIFLFSRRFFSKNSGLMYCYYSRAASNQERIMIARVRYITWVFKINFGARICLIKRILGHLLPFLFLTRILVLAARKKRGSQKRLIKTFLCKQSPVRNEVDYPSLVWNETDHHPFVLVSLFCFYPSFIYSWSIR